MKSSHHHENTHSNSSSASGAFSSLVLLYCPLDLIHLHYDVENLGKKQYDFPQDPAPLIDDSGAFI